MIIGTTINDALIEIGVLNPIDEATPQNLAHGLRILNRIIDSYNTQNLTITYLEDIALPQPTQWANSVTIGNGKDIDFPAPLEAESAFFRQGSVDYHLHMMASNEWGRIGFKFDSGIPTKYYLQKTNTNDLKIYFDRIPQSNLVLHLMAKKPYTGVNGEGNDYVATDDINWNYGFEKMLMTRLAVELCSSYEITPSNTLTYKMQEAENNVKTHNYQPMVLETSHRLKRGYRRNRGNYR